MVFEITGAGEDVNYLEKQIEENELKNVNFHGYVPRETLKKLEEEASAFVVFQNNDSVFSRTNFPSKLFHYISFCKPVFVNRCDIFNKYGEFENVFFIDPTNSMEKIKKILSDRKKTYANVKQQMERYNNSIGKEIVDLLGVETLTDN
jgi:glycosyltransferase involved in cell wall biosynthesis